MKWKILLAAVLVMVVSCALLADGVRLPLVEYGSRRNPSPGNGRSFGCDH